MVMPGWNPDWGRLYSDGRCKFHWVAWTDAEYKMIQESKDKQETINMIRDGYIETHKAEIIDPKARFREDSKEKEALMEEYELLYGKKPHHMASITTIKKKIAEKEAIEPVYAPTKAVETEKVVSKPTKKS